MLFTNYQRNDSSAKTNRESEFGFLDRSARPEIERVRQFLETLAMGYPEEELAELVTRVRSGNDTHFKSSIFELVLHAFLVRLGYTLRPHPELPNGSKARPDFHVIAPSGEEFYLEAVLASADDDTDPAAEARIGSTLDALAKASHANFMVAVEHEGVPDTQPSGKRLLTAALRWLDSLDPDEVQAEIDRDGLYSAPTFSWGHEEWQVLLRAIPLKPERRGNARTLIGLLDGGAGLIDEWTPIRDAIKFKGSKYGHLDKPLLVAVNFGSFHLDRIDELQALFGQEQYVLAVGKPEKEPRLKRAPNGAWFGKSGPQARCVSGAWLFNDLTAYSLASRRHTIYFNPWATNPLPEALKTMPHAVANEREMQWHPGSTLSDVLGLPGDWPEDG
ncbi:hypothetical protein D3879_24825 [Pseudomonas cavernicola]|uniref:Uncharacterized protein n=1 Tax=Pseudomonas cavernicola TaxID=2320866 RepID=A0A418X9A1_9PSED|nr:hypothetical protein [Pseudomonas cavernicola]RJG09041.1 hypothetical protein D3879_24825 [Pseudomonas cavernicola]